MALTIDLNADLGEECGDDLAMLAIVSSANVACGMHAGNLAVLYATLAAATARGVRCGAHPSYPDRANFGRTSMADTLPAPEREASVAAQLSAFKALYSAHSPTGVSDLTTIPYIKAHGALYNDASRHRSVARALVKAAKGSALMHQPNTWVHYYAALLDVPFIAEVFADRAYLDDGTLAPRNMAGAVLHDPAEIAGRVVRMVTERSVETIDGTVFTFDKVDSVCVHGDTPGAVRIARAVRDAVEDAGIAVNASPARSPIQTPSRTS